MVDYARIGEEERLSFWDVFRIARGLGDVLIGYVPHSPRALRRGLALDDVPHRKVSIQLRSL